MINVSQYKVVVFFNSLLLDFMHINTVCKVSRT